MNTTVFNEYKQFYIENWHHSLRSDGFHRVGVALERDIVLFLMNIAIINPGSYNIDIPNSKNVRKFISELQYLLRYYNNGAFIRLGSRSHKDSIVYQNLNYKIESVLHFLMSCAGSNRLLEDLSLAEEQGYTPYLWLMPYKYIHPQDEFRIFIKDNKVIGISQYDYTKEYKFIHEHKDTILWVINNFLTYYIGDTSKKTIPKDCIIDCIVEHKQYSDNHIDWNCRFLEINPFSIFTDACCYTWVTGEKDITIISSLVAGNRKVSQFMYVGMVTYD